MLRSCAKFSAIILVTSTLALLPGCSFFKKKKSKATSNEQISQTGKEGEECGNQDCRSLPYVNKITALNTFDSFAADDHQMGAFSKSVKFFVDTRSAIPSIYYINGNYRAQADAAIQGEIPESAKLHYDFAMTYLQIPEGSTEYNQVTYFTNEKTYYAGSVQRYVLEGENETIYGVQFFPQDVINEQAVIKALEFTSKTFNIPTAKMAFVSTGQHQTTASVAAGIESLGYRILTIDAVLGSLKYMPLNSGEAWGYLRVFPENQDDLRATDIVVFDKLPLDLTVVAGVITKSYQDPNSHVNLKSRERQTPNMMLRDASADHAVLMDFINKPVKLRVNADSFEISAATAEEIEAKYRERMARPWVALTWEAESSLLAYDQMCPIDPAYCSTLKKKFGSKSVNLGFLAQSNVLGRVEQSGSLSQQAGYDLSPKGFGVPFSFYKNLIDAPENSSVKSKLEAFIALEKAGTLSPSERRSLASDLRLAILGATLPAANLQTILARIATDLPGINRFKVRSSANAEDISGFTGAGLYDSFKAKVNTSTSSPSTTPAELGGCTIINKLNKHGAIRQRVMPETFECAIKATYASLWNVRAIEERSFARIDHATTTMGLAIVPGYDIGSKIASNTVLVTRIPNTRTLSGYSLSTYHGNNLVTNPAPGTWSELGIAVLLTTDVPTSLTITRFAKSKVDQPAPQSPVMSRNQTLAVVAIARAVEIAWCQSNPGYYPAATEGRATCEYTVWDDLKPKALDFEFKFREDGRLVAKQVREFTGKK